MGKYLKAGETSPVDLLCFDQAMLGKLNGLISEGTICCNKLTGSIQKPIHWYQNQWIWATVGLVIGGVSVGYVATR